MRCCYLHLKIVLRSLGALPWLVLAIYAAASSLQEPLFFRELDANLVWPGGAALEDFLTLASLLLWSESIPRECSSGSALQATGSLIVVALGVSLVGSATCTIFDCARGLPWQPDLLFATAVRAFLVWAPLAMLVVGLSPMFRIQGRLAVLATAFLLQALVHRVSMAAPVPGVGNVLSSLLAFSGSAALALAMRPRQTGAP
jgi:hypothetical protein